MNQYNLPIRKIDFLVGKHVVLRLTGNRKYSGYCDCICPLPVNDDSEDEEDFLRFVADNGENMFLSDSEIIGIDF